MVFVTSNKWLEIKGDGEHLFMNYQGRDFVITSILNIKTFNYVSFEGYYKDDLKKTPEKIRVALDHVYA